MCHSLTRSHLLLFPPPAPLTNNENKNNNINNHRTSGVDDMAVMLPGIWLFSASALPLLFSETMFSVGLWIIFLTLGEVCDLPI